MTPHELRAQAQQLTEDARALYNQITDETPAERAAEIERQFDDMMADRDRLVARADRAERLAHAESDAEEIREREAREARDARRPGGETPSAPVSESRDQVDEYREVFARFIGCGGDPSAMSPEERAILQRGHDASAEFRTQTGATNTAGGYTVPTTLATFIDAAMAATGPMYRDDMATVINTAGGETFPIPTIDDTANTAAAHTEGAALTDDGSGDAIFGQASLAAYTYATPFIKWSMELEQDSILNFEQLLGQLIGERLGRITNSKLTTGSGSSDVKGVVTAALSGKTAASGTAITADEIIDLYHSVDPAYRAGPRVKFMMHDNVALAIRKLKDSNGQYLWNQDLTKGQPAYLLGVPVQVNMAMASSIAINAKTIMFGDFGRFYVRKVGSPVMGVMRERFWPNLGIAGLVRFDGEIGQSGAIKYLQQAAA